MATNLLTRTGNKIKVTLDGKEVGLVQSIRANDDYAPEPAVGIGDIAVTEYVPTVARHTVSVSQMVLYANSMRKAGVAIENGAAALNGLVFDIVITDKKDNATRTYTGCSYASGDMEVSTNKIVMANAQFNALSVNGGTF